MTRVVELNSLEQLEPYRLAWASLWRRTRRASFSQTLEWFAVFFRHDPGVVRPRVLVVLDDDDEPLGILPLAVCEEATSFGTQRVLGYPLSPFVETCGPVGNLPTVTLQEGLRHIAKTPHDWDLIDLRGIDAALADPGRTRSALSMAGLPAIVEPWCDRAVVELPDDWNLYRQTREPGRRGRIEHLLHKLERRAEVLHVRYRPDGTMHGDDDPRWDLYADCLTIARRSWQASEPGGVTLSNLGQADYFRAAHAAAARVGCLDLNLLYVDGAPAAFAYNFVVGDMVTRAATGYAANFAEERVGTILTWLTLRDSHGRRDRTMDFGSGGDDWKRFWSTARRTSARVTHCPPRSWKSNLVRWGRSLRRAMRAS